MAVRSKMSSALAEAIREAYCVQRERFVAMTGYNLGEKDPEASLDDAEWWREREIACWDGGEDSRGVRFRSKWPALATLAEESHLTPAVWAKALFSMAYIFRRVPAPQDLRNPKVLDRARNWANHHGQEAYHLTSSQFSSLLRACWNLGNDTGMAPAEAAAAVVIDTNQDASALVRYAVASKHNLSLLCRVLEYAALIDYRASPIAYLESLGENFPTRLLELDQQEVK